MTYPDHNLICHDYGATYPDHAPTYFDYGATYPDFSTYPVYENFYLDYHTMLLDYETTFSSDETICPDYHDHVLIFYVSYPFYHALWSMFPEHSNHFPSRHPFRLLCHHVCRRRHCFLLHWKIQNQNRGHTEQDLKGKTILESFRKEAKKKCTNLAFMGWLYEGWIVLSTG